MRFYIYCPCKVHEIGLARVSGYYYPYLLWKEIKYPGSTRIKAECKFCGEPVRMLDNDPVVDRAAGLTRRIAKKMMRQADEEPMGEGDDDG